MKSRSLKVCVLIDSLGFEVEGAGSEHRVLLPKIKDKLKPYTGGWNGPKGGTWPSSLFDGSWVLESKYKPYNQDEYFVVHSIEEVFYKFIPPEQLCL